VVEPGAPGNYDLKIRSCRRKQWSYLTTILYNDQLYVLHGEESGLAPRRFVYLLRCKPEQKVVRGLQCYDPEEPLRESGWTAAPE
jgi:hypothetical protein